MATKEELFQLLEGVEKSLVALRGIMHLRHAVMGVKVSPDEDLYWRLIQMETSLLFLHADLTTLLAQTK